LTFFATRSECDTLEMPEIIREIAVPSIFVFHVDPNKINRGNSCLP